MTTPSVFVIQSDNRTNLNYLNNTRTINETACATLNYKYIFIDMNVIIKKYKIHHSWDKYVGMIGKIYLIYDFLINNNHDIIIFLDSDAWIQELNYLEQLINNLYNNNKNGCFSRDPYFNKATFINSGSFIIKNNDYIKQMYTQLIKTYELFKKNNSTNACLNPTDKYDDFKKVYGDQYFISDYVDKNKLDFMIFKPNILNTPSGIILRHNWWKHISLFNDTNDILNNKIIFKKDFFNIESYFDTEEYPNTSNQTAENSYCYPIETAQKYGLV